MKNEIGNKIKRAREEKKISQNKLAERVKYLNQSQICKIENGNRFVRVDDVNKIAYALSIPVKQLIR